MPRLKDELTRLVAIQGISAPDFPEETRAGLVECYEALLPLLREAGVQKLDALELPNTAPVLTGEIPGPESAPTALLYGHYDVVPAGVRYDKWIRFMLPLMGTAWAAAVVMLGIAALME